jgi:sugar phosphate isomerase/epimerase
MKNNYGIQLYSVRDAMEKDMAATLKEIAALGYKYVEFAGFFGRSAAEVKAMLDENGLVCSGTHSPWTDLRPTKIMEAVAYHKTIGNPYYIVPGADLSTLEKIEDFCNVMNFAQPILAAEGIKLGYHNHSHEFVVMPWGSTIHGEIERRTKVDFEIDTFWTFNAGLDSIKVLERLQSRVKVIHLKDGFKGGKGIPLGQGEAPVKAVVDYAVSKGLTMVVESETLTPSGMDEAKACIEFLKTID